MKRLLLLIALASVAACRDQALVDPSNYQPGGRSTASSSGDDLHLGDGTDTNSHFRLGHISWKPAGTNTAEFTYVIALRRSFYSPLPNVGDQRTLARINFGDGSDALPTFKVTFVDAANDWFEARATFTHTYPGSGPYTAFSSSCCRLSPYTASHAYPWDHVNNPDKNARFETVVSFASAGSAVSGLPALVTCPIEGDCRFTVAATAPGGQTLRWRLATPAEMGGSTLTQPSSSTGGAAAIDQNTGVYTWNTRGAAANRSRDRDNDGDLDTYQAVYSTQVVIETLSGDQVTSKSVIDFLIHLTNANPPTFTSPPSPTDGSAYTLSIGQSLSFTIEASDPDPGDVITLGALGLPSGASLPAASAANPVSSTFSWTPQPGQAGAYVINFLATDQGGLQSRPLSISVNVPNRPPTAKAGGPYTGAPGSAVQFDGSGSGDADDPGGSTLRYTWDFGDGSSASGQKVSHTYASSGTYNVTLTVTDADGASASATTTAKIDPVVTVTVVPASGQRCDATVTARNTSKDEFHLQQANAATCKAAFVLTAGEKYVFSVHNEIISDVDDHRVWPDADGVPTDDNLPNRVGAVLIEPGTSARLTDDNYYSARAAATALTGNRDISISFQPGERIIACTLNGANTAAYVYAMLPLSPGLVPPSSSTLPPALGTYVDRTDSSGGSCELKGVPSDELVVVEAKEDDGDTYRALVAPGETSVTLEEDPGFFRVDYILDPWGDNSVGKDDVGLVVFGLNRVNGAPGDEFTIKADTRAVQERGTAQFLFDIAELNGGAGFQVKVICSKQQGTCKLAEVSPSSEAAKVLGVEGSLNPNTGDGWVSVRLNFAGINSAKLRLRAGIDNGYDYAPDGGGFTQWTRSGNGDNSFNIAF
jgi:hypothetical protein